MADLAHKTESSTSRACCCSQERATQAGPGASEHRHAGPAAHGGHDHHAPEAIKEGVRDPVCGMTVDPHVTPHRQQHDGHPYYFCSEGCLAKFVAEPAKYLGNVPMRVENVAEGTIYTCPMHPQIRQVGPGNCPICGMALEPELATAETGPNPELLDMTRRFWVGLALSVPVVILEMGGHLIGGHGWIDQSLSNWIQLESD